MKIQSNTQESASEIIQIHGAYVFTFGKHKGKRVSQVIEEDPGYIVWLDELNNVSVDPQLVDDALDEAIERHYERIPDDINY